MTRTRAERRHHHKRMIARTKKFAERFFNCFSGTEEEKDKYVCQLAETRKPCSCEMCGNPRKFYKYKTLQEKRAEMKQKDEH